MLRFPYVITRQRNSKLVYCGCGTKVWILEWTPDSKQHFFTYKIPICIILKRALHLSCGAYYIWDDDVSEVFSISWQTSKITLRDLVKFGNETFALNLIAAFAPLAHNENITVFAQANMNNAIHSFVDSVSH